MAKAECNRLDVVSISRKTKARAARVYNDRSVALVDVCGEEPFEIGADGEVSVRGKWGVRTCFVSVLVAVGIEAEGRQVQKVGGKPKAVGFHVKRANMLNLESLNRLEVYSTIPDWVFENF